MKSTTPPRKTRLRPIRSPRRPASEQEAAERDQVGVDDPGEVGLAEAQVALDGRAAQRSRSSRRGDHELARQTTKRAIQRRRGPATASVHHRPRVGESPLEVTVFVHDRQCIMDYHACANDLLSALRSVCHGRLRRVDGPADTAESPRLSLRDGGGAGDAAEAVRHPQCAARSGRDAPAGARRADARGPEQPRASAQRRRGRRLGGAAPRPGRSPAPHRRAHGVPAWRPWTAPRRRSRTSRTRCSGR